MEHLAGSQNVLILCRSWKWKWDRHASVLSRHLVRLSFQGRPESEWAPCRVARRRVQLSKTRWSYLPTDDSGIVLSDSSVWKVLWIQSQMPPLLWYSCLDTKSTWNSIWSQHATLHVRQLLSQNCLFRHLSPPTSPLLFFGPTENTYAGHFIRCTTRSHSRNSVHLRFYMWWRQFAKFKPSTTFKRKGDLSNFVRTMDACDKRL